MPLLNEYFGESRRSSSFVGSLTFDEAAGVDVELEASLDVVMDVAF